MGVASTRKSADPLAEAEEVVVVELEDGGLRVLLEEDAVVDVAGGADTLVVVLGWLCVADTKVELDVEEVEEVDLPEIAK